MNKWVRWVFDKYYGDLGLDKIEGSQKYKDYITKVVKALWRVSNIPRVQAFQTLKFGYVLDKAGYTLYTCSLQTKGSQDQPANYAYIYWPNCTPRSPKPEYISISTTFESRDGEFRDYFIQYDVFDTEYDRMSADFDAIEQALIALEESHEIALEIITEATVGDAATDYLENTRIGLRLLAVMLCTHAYEYKYNSLPQHSVDNQIKALRFLYERVFDDKAWATDFNKFTVFKTGNAEFSGPHATHCGQKLIPLTENELMNAQNMNYAPWLEVWVAQKVTNLIINGVAATYPIFGDWVLVSGIDARYFDNTAILEKYKQSGEIGEIQQRNLKTAYAAIQKTGNTKKIQKMLHLLDQINKYAKCNIVLTDIAILQLVESVGDTLNTVPHLYRTAQTAENSGVYARLAEPDVFLRFLFDICYGAAALHKNGIVHTDIHMNNLTLYINSYNAYGEKFAKAEAEVAYVMGSEQETYVFPHDGAFCCIIDFSRALLTARDRGQIAGHIGAGQTEKLYTAQKEAFIDRVRTHAPAFLEKHRSALEGAYLLDIDSALNALSTVDFIATSRCFRKLHAAFEKPLPPQVAETLNQLDGHAYKVFIRDLQMLIEKKKIPQPRGGELIARAFTSYRYGARATHRELACVFNINAPLRYDSVDYHKFPPWGDFEEIEKHKGGYTIGDFTNNRGKEKFLHSVGRPRTYLDIYQNKARHLLQTDARSSSEPYY